MAEHRFYTPLVEGSSPSGPTTDEQQESRDVLIALGALICKVCGKHFPTKRNLMSNTHRCVRCIQADYAAYVTDCDRMGQKPVAHSVIMCL